MSRVVQVEMREKETSLSSFTQQHVLCTCYVLSMMLDIHKNAKNPGQCLRLQGISLERDRDHRLNCRQALWNSSRALYSHNREKTSCSLSLEGTSWELSLAGRRKIFQVTGGESFRDVDRKCTGNRALSWGNQVSRYGGKSSGLEFLWFCH